MNRLFSFPTPLLPRFVRNSVITVLIVVFFCSSASAAGLYVTLDGTGGGFVTSDPPGISCPIASCFADFPDGSPVSLIPTPNSTSTFSGWSNACTNATGNCSVSMDITKTAGAHFTAAPKARIVATGTGYATLSAAYSAANSGDTIMALDSVMPDTSLNIDAAMAQGKSITIKGGYTADYSGRSLLPTSVHGPLSLGSGSLQVDGLAIIPNDNVGTVAITATSGAHGTVTPTGVTTLSLGASKTYTITPNTGYTIAALTMDGNSITPAPSYSFSNVQADHLISATFSIIHTGGSTTIADVAEACAAEPMRGTVYHYCDCAAGADSSCVAGNDATGDGSAANPFRGYDYLGYNASTTYAMGDTVTSNSLDYMSLVSNNTNHFPNYNIGTYWKYVNSANHSVTATSRLNTVSGINTFAFCKGGAFNSVRGKNVSATCSAGSFCNDLRDYTPPSGATAKPIINNAPGNLSLFSFMGNVGGVRILNLRLQGALGGTYGDNNDAFFFYNGAHDVTMCNLEVDGFDIALHQSGGNASVAANPNIKLTGSNIANSRTIGYLGGGPNLEISYNYWDGNGGSNMFDHTIYLSSYAVSNVSFIGNYIHGQYGPTCSGVVLTAHGGFDYLTVANNVIDIDTAAGTGGCYGMAFGSGGYKSPSYYRHSIFAGNTVSNAGNIGIYMSACPDCVIENNLIKVDKRVGMVGIYAGAEAARPLYNDDVNDRNLIRNNTIWYGPNATGGGIGVKVATEGTGHVVVNNTVTYTSTEPGIWGGVRCNDYPLPLASYLFINNNHCFSNATYSWVAGHGSLSDWQTYASASGFDTKSVTGNPLFPAAGTDFTPAAGSPLLGAGTALYGSLLDMNGKTRTNPPAIGALEGNTFTINVSAVANGTLSSAEMQSR